MRVDERNRAKEIIEDFMIAANGVTARFLHGKKVPSLRRMVRSPKRWGRIVEIAAQHNSQLPAEPDSRALASFLVAQKAALAGSPVSYGREELVGLARHCTEKENDANKVERLVAKSAAAMLLASRIGDQLDAICTGAADKGTWVRIFRPPTEGRLLYGYEGVDVGSRLKVQLIHTDIEKGFIDFKKVRSDL